MTDDNKQIAATLAAAIIHSTSPDTAVAVYRSCLAMTRRPLAAVSPA